MDSTNKSKAKQTQPTSSRNENSILSTIVDAMLDAEGELQAASVEKWTKVLLEACRRQKGDASLRHVPNMAA